MGASYLRPEFYDCFIKNIRTMPNKHNLLAVFEKLIKGYPDSKDLWKAKYESAWCYYQLGAEKKALDEDAEKALRKAVEEFSKSYAPSNKSH